MSNVNPALSKVHKMAGGIGIGHLVGVECRGDALYKQLVVERVGPEVSNVHPSKECSSKNIQLYRLPSASAPTCQKRVLACLMNSVFSSHTQYRLGLLCIARSGSHACCSSQNPSPYLHSIITKPKTKVCAPSGCKATREVVHHNHGGRLLAPTLCLDQLDALLVREDHH